MSDSDSVRESVTYAWMPAFEVFVAILALTVVALLAAAGVAGMIQMWQHL